MARRKVRSAGQIGAVLAAITVLTGCWQILERDMMERLDTMEGHLTALFAATDALGADDAARFRQAMKQLERGGELPGMASDADLAALHAAAHEAGRRSGSARDRVDGWSAVVALCASCHAAHAVPRPPLVEARSPVESATIGLVWSDEDTWMAAASELGLPRGDAWGERRLALRRHLGGSP